MVAQAGLLLVVGAGGVAYYVATKDDMPAVPAPGGPPPGTKVMGGGTLLAYPIKTTSGKSTAVSATTPKSPGSTAQPTPGKTGYALAISAGISSSTAAAQRAKNDIYADVEKKAREEFNKLDAEARRAGAKALNEEYGFDPPLDGTEDFDTLMKAFGTGAGAAFGNAVCGPICGKLGAVIGAYIGGKIAEWLSDEWGDIKAKAEELWNDAKNWLGGAAEDVGDAISDGLDYINPF